MLQAMHINIKPALINACMKSHYFPRNSIESYSK